MKPIDLTIKQCIELCRSKRNRDCTMCPVDPICRELQLEYGTLFRDVNIEEISQDIDIIFEDDKKIIEQYK